MTAVGSDHPDPMNASYNEKLQKPAPLKDPQTEGPPTGGEDR